MKSQKVLIGLIAILVVIGFISCDLLSAVIDEDKGALILNINSDDIATKTLVPDVTMSIVTYDISGSGPDGATFSDTGIADPTYIQNDLLIGAWTVTVDGRNGDGTKIASATEAFSITGEQTTTVPITIIPLTGTGILTINMSWPADEITAPDIVATLAPNGGSSSPIEIIVSGDTASFSDATLAAGYYTLTIQLKDGSTVVWGLAEAVRILAGETTIATLDLTLDDINPLLVGDLQLNITEDLQNPIGITLTGGQTTLFVGADMTVTANPTIAPDSYQWYLNGALLSGEEAAPITIGSGLAEGNYRLDVVVQNGSISSSVDLRFSVSEASSLVQMLSVPGGMFQRDATASNTTTVSTFSMSKYEITQAQYQQIIGMNPSAFASETDAPNRPVEQVSWYDALVFCNMLSMAEGRTPAYTISSSTDPAAWGSVPTSDNATWNAAIMNMSTDGYRLPTEAEWMWAAMGATSGAGYAGSGTYTTGYQKEFAGDPNPTIGGDVIDDYAWYRLNAFDVGLADPDYGTHAVGTKLANELGLYDMSGNVLELTWDRLADYSNGPLVDPQGPATGTNRVLRGGSWYDTYASGCTVVYRVYFIPDRNYGHVGFRVMSR
jgi:formylglycine-generating enzyme required for sulfatase activity